MLPIQIAITPVNLVRHLHSLLIFFCTVSIITQVRGQSFIDDLKISGSYHYGYVLPEYSYFLYIVNKPVQSASLNFSKTTNGKNDWEKMYNYPEYGISLFYSTLGNNQVFGREFAIVPYFHLNIISRKHFHFFNETGVGFTYVTKHFDFEKDYENIAIGSHGNVHFNLKFGIDYRVSKKFLVNAGLSFDHFSNANTQNPNLGINYVTAFTRLSYKLGNESEKQTGELSPHHREIEYELIGSEGAKKSRGVLQSNIFYTTSLTFEAKWTTWRALHLGVGTDFFYDPSAKTEMQSLNNLNFKSADNFTSGIHLSQEFVYSKLSLILQEGFYLGLTDQVNNKRIYNRGIIRIRVSTHSFVQLAMKSHLNILDYPELGFGMKWK